MLLKQYDLVRLARPSRLIADTPTGNAVVVDPQRDIDQYPFDATPHRCHIRDVFPTHFHTALAVGLSACHRWTQLCDLIGGIGAREATGMNVVAAATVWVGPKGDDNGD